MHVFCHHERGRASRAGVVRSRWLWWFGEPFRHSRIGPTMSLNPAVICFRGCTAPVRYVLKISHREGKSDIGNSLI